MIVVRLGIGRAGAAHVIGRAGDKKWDASRRSAADIADLIHRDEEYALDELERLEAWDVVDLEKDGRVRLRHRHIVVAPLAGGGADTSDSENLDKRARARRGLCDLRTMLEEIVDDGSSVQPGIDAAVDAAHALEGLDRAEAALEKWDERDIHGEWHDAEE